MPYTLPIPVREASRRRSALTNATLFVVAAGLAWRVARYVANWPLWGDEAFLAVSLITRDFAGLARPLEYFQIAPVGFLWAERAVVWIFGPGEWALRLLPFLAGIGALFLFWAFAKKNLAPRAALLAVAFFAASFYPVRHAAEVKPYATDLLFSLTLTCLARWTWFRPNQIRRWLALTATAAVGVWASYPLVFVAGGIGAWLGVKVASAQSRSWVKRWLGFVTVTALSWALMYVAFARQQARDAPFYQDMPTWEDSFPPVLRPWALPWWFLKAHTGNMMAYPYGGNRFGSIATALLMLNGVLVLWRRDKALLGLLLAPAGPAFLAAALHRYPYGTSARISLYLAPAICLIAGQGLSALLASLFSRPQARRSLRIVTAALGLAAIAGAIVSLAMPYKHSSDLAYRRIARELAKKAKAGDLWLVFNGLDDLPRVKELMLMPWLAHAAQFHYYVLRDAPVPVAWSPDPHALPVATSGRTWFILHVMDYDGLPPPTYIPQLETLTRRFGPPATEEYEANPNEHVIAAVFSAPARSP